MTLTNLNENWSVQSSAKIAGDGFLLSTGTADTNGWHVVDLPATVLGALVESGVFEDPFFAKRLLDIPGQGPKADNFSNHPMPDDSPFKVPWWFRKVFRIPKDSGPRLALKFDGINYRANIWLNGRHIADTSRIAGAYREFELDITDFADRDGENYLAVEVFPSRPCDVAITWVDWNPSPPDKNMGLWRDVWLRGTGPVAIVAPYVATELDESGRARLTVACDLSSSVDRKLSAKFRAVIEERTIEEEVSLAPLESRRFEARLEVENPRLWWPRALGKPELYRIEMEVAANDELSDEAAFDFGIREVKSELTEDGYALFRVNGEPVLVRGAGWATDLFLRRRPERDRAELEYVKDMNLNAIRFEGMLERAEFLERCDRDGIMVISGWSCCDAWEKWDNWDEETHEIAAESLRSQIRRARRHPCMIAWWYGSDFAPPPRVEKRYLEILKEERWPNPVHSSAANKPTDITGPSGMKMEGPYDYVPPNYWLEDTVRGGAFGFATEICPGPAVPPIESLTKMMPKENLWPVDDMWRFHAGGKEFHSIKAFADALLGRLGPVDGAEEFAKLSQLMTYESQRAMFEAYALNKYRSTGVIQWMLNNAWPSIIWHLYDYYLRPGGGYFGAKKACEPLHVMYSYKDATVAVVNELPRAFGGLRVDARVLSAGFDELFNGTFTAEVKPGGKAVVSRLPNFDGASPVYFIELKLYGSSGELVSRNSYWVPAKLDVLDFEKASWMNTPISEYADLRALRRLKRTELHLEADVERSDTGDTVRVELKNLTDRLAFFVQMRLADDAGDDVLPVLWSDNYVSIFPGDAFSARARLLGGARLNGDLHLHVTGLNTAPMELVLRKRKERSHEDGIGTVGRGEPTGVGGL